MLTASCLCGGIQLELHGNLRPVVNCHCSQCLKTHGNFAAYTNLPRSAVHYVKQDTLRWYRSSDSAQRGFCNGCGASVFWSRDDDDAISVAAGVL
ncbi:MAG: GFA family protein, partial [Gammaproteobacteria bacterium]|nr:GFA family protein [Gammaproteobacteria bacterium]